MPKFPNVKVTLTGRDSDAFRILARVRTAMRKSGVAESSVREYSSRATSGDYDNLLRVTAETVQVR